MTSDHRATPGLIHDILDTLERHGYYRSDDLHADRAIGLIGDLAGIYEGTQDYPAGAHVIDVPSFLPAPGGRAAPDGGMLTDRDVRTVVAALDVAAEYKRDRAEMCADCPDQSCYTCQARLRSARTYDQMIGRLTRAAEATRAAGPRQPGPDRRAQPVADREAGQ